jgi:transcriptional regulator with XRE-family HTH domain
MNNGQTNNEAPRFAVLPTEIGKRIREARQSVGLSQEDLGDKVGLSRVTINQIENGKRKQLKAKILEDIALATDKPQSFFLSTHLAVATIVTSDTASKPLGEILPRLWALPPKHQDRVGLFIEQVLDWYEAQVMDEK